MLSEPALPSSTPAPADLGHLAHLRRSMIGWAEPVIADCIGDRYRELRLGTAFQSLLVTHHRRLWRALILGQGGLADSLRADLRRDLTRAGVAHDIAEHVDCDVLEELMDIVLKRFRASRDTAKGFSLVLLSAASALGPRLQAAA